MLIFFSIFFFIAFLSMLIEQNYNIGLYIYLFLGCLFFILYKHQKSKQNNNKEQSFSPLTSLKDKPTVSNTINIENELIKLKHSKLNIQSSIQSSSIQKELINLDNMNNEDFKNYINNLLTKLGYISTINKSINNKSADILAEKDNIKYAIHCINQIKPINYQIIHKINSAKIVFDCDLAIVITNNFFTKQAISQAKKLRVILIDRDSLIDMLNESYHINH